ncbi:MAG: chorismate synthase [Omnitrophica WOR_2 bacterium RIFCSPLOWO2_02_FULL_63_16]|nr:MAG: chorismate synthase [Omnitrophica WOR_2 bacterium GWA2_63_20]OGX32259.1 MAG: chorismate synthase [Omnitrophica WOR_2 bacterium RIFCSPHIGHO2_12_FULL_64_13]OGX36423.1 MAG: chorismate synthase [Omnitrophica WOR_2 bacterium RIFCSPHIGHO2_02_FULL_63_39]OGX45417.1 MAG: chorismate synthase [Omnitrophica WOR_2 bacterium RIFCSPLOWO2_02_FULL_63_16]HBQ38013.1 chorismate synthase [Candidatus Omnitrophota bacterium]
MSRLRFLTAGESHGTCLVAILEGLPAGVPIDAASIEAEMKRRQFGYGRGPRMKFEADRVELLSGVRHGKTLGSPVALSIANKDASIDRLPVVTQPRPGHADLAGAIKYDHRDIRNVLERASARETAARVAVGAICKQALSALGIEVASHVIALGSIRTVPARVTVTRLRATADRNPVRCLDARAAKQMMRLIDRCAREGDTLGGAFEVVVEGAPPGLGSHVHYDRRLDALLGQAVLSIHAVKGVEVGEGVRGSSLRGSQLHDEIFYSKAKGFSRSSNRSGGFEGGMTTGEPVIVRGFMKPLSTLRKPLRSVEIHTKKPVVATVERSDVTTVPAAGVVAEAMVAFVLTQAMLEKFGGDSLRELQRNLAGYRRQVQQF